MLRGLWDETLTRRFACRVMNRNEISIRLCGGNGKCTVGGFSWEGLGGSLLFCSGCIPRVMPGGELALILVLGRLVRVDNVLAKKKETGLHFDFKNLEK